MGLRDEEFRAMSDKHMTFLVDYARSKKITQAMIAERTGFAQSNVARLESCAYSPTLTVFLKYASAVGVHMELMAQDDEEYNYDLKPSEIAGHYVCTDTDNFLMCVFEKGKFNETQKFTFLHDLSADKLEQLPSILRKMGDWLTINHPDIV